MQWMGWPDLARRCTDTRTKSCIEVIKERERIIFTMLTKPLITQTVLDTAAVYARRLGIHGSTLMRYVGLGLIRIAAQATGGDYLFDPRNAERDVVYFKNTCQTPSADEQRAADGAMSKAIRAELERLDAVTSIQPRQEHRRSDPVRPTRQVMINRNLEPVE